MKSPSDISDIRPADCAYLYTIADPNIAERAILDLSVVIQRRMTAAGRRNAGSWGAVSYEAQIIAYVIFEQFGLDGTLDEIAKGA